MSNEVRVAGKLGAKPNDPRRLRLHIGQEHLKATPPASVDYYNAIGGGGMLGNDQYGDCVFASNGHITEQQSALGQGAEVTVTEDEVLQEYSNVTGFNPNDPSTDNGAEVQQGLDDLRKNGLAGHKITAFAQINVSDMQTVKNAISEFGIIDIGMDVPASAMSQFNSGQPWDVVADDGGIEGGHCVCVAGYDENYLYVYTWNAVQKMTYAFWNAYVSEAWALVSEDWVNSKSGVDPEKVDLSTLGQEFASLTGQPNPFPAPSPTPTPNPPSPTPKPSWWDEFIKWIESFFK